jgi:hypothetical protein
VNGQVVRADALGSKGRGNYYVAEDFALLTTRTASARYAADFLATVGNVSFSNIDLKLFKYTLNFKSYSKLPEKCIFPFIDVKSF